MTPAQHDRATVTYHGPHHDHAGRSINWPAQHLVVVALPRDPRPYDVRRLDALEAAAAYCAPDAYDEPDDHRHRHPAYTYTLRNDRAGLSVAVVMGPTT